MLPLPYPTLPYPLLVPAAVQVLARTHPLAGRLLCALTRCLLRFCVSDTGRVQAARALADCFAMYDRIYAADMMDLVVPCIALGTADQLGGSLGYLCTDLRRVKAIVSAAGGGLGHGVEAQVEPDVSVGTVDVLLTRTMRAVRLLEVSVHRKCCS